GAWPFMLAMRELGLGDLSRAVQEIVDVMRQRLRQRSRRDASGQPDAAVESLRAIFGLMFDDEIVDMLDAARVATIGLCFGRNPVEVCNAFVPHLDADRTIAVTTPDAAIGCIVAMLFFAVDLDAVFSVIDRDEFKLSAPGAGRGAPELSRIALGLAADPTMRVAPFARFLACTFEALSTLPALLGRPMQDHVALRVKSWCRDAVRTAATLPAVKELLCRVRSDPRAALGSAITVLMRSDEDFRKPGTPLQALAIDVFTDVTDWGPL
ncbi:MAG TPA: hypothetical protein VIX73_16270, partial [Kofleriaceae bacterium]